ncbi:MAG TPA: RCC1 domain-containing protein, partial [Chitinophagaceae bacterium]
SDGTLWAWGYNGNGQLGDGTNIQRNIPIQVGTDDDWVGIEAGTSYSLGLKSNGSLWTWGYNGGGKISDGTSLNRLIPVQIETDEDD